MEWRVSTSQQSEETYSQTQHETLCVCVYISVIVTVIREYIHAMHAYVYFWTDTKPVILTGLALPQTNWKDNIIELMKKAEDKYPLKREDEILNIPAVVGR